MQSIIIGKIDRRGKYQRSDKQRELLRVALAKRIKNGEKLGFQKGQKQVYTEERNRKISSALIGHPMYKSKERSEKLSKAFKGRVSTFKGKHHTKESKEKMRLANTKKDSLAPLISKIRWNSKYAQWKADVFNRDNNKCVKCNDGCTYLEAHHINPIYKILEQNKIDNLEKAINCQELWDINNGITLCTSCHSKEDQHRHFPQKDLIIGAGEIGRSLFNVLNQNSDTILIDREKPALGQIRYLHICFPYSEEFIREVKKYQRFYRPIRTIIHSTCPVGTSRKCNAIHSPCLGVHPYLDRSFKTFIKFLGGEQAGEVADYFRRHDIKVYLTDKPETTELMKILCTTKYGVDIEYVKEVKRQCDKYQVPFEMWTLWTENYNQGYKKLDQEQFTRPNLIPNMQKISGHCVMPNTKLLDNQFTKLLKELNK